MTNSSVAQAQTSSPTTTGVMVILTVKAGVAREQVMAVMPAEIRATVQLYLLQSYVQVRALFWLNARGLDYLAPLLGFFGDERAEGSGRALKRGAA